MVFHCVALPHTNTTSDYVVCAFTEKVRKFCNMMSSLGHTVYLYGGTVTEAQCTELITCISEEDRAQHVCDRHYVEADLFGELVNEYHSRVIYEINERATPTDYICLIGGLAQKPIADAFPGMISVEYGIGYGGTFAKYRVFESYSWMHTCYAQGVNNVHDIDGRAFDAVIPNYFEEWKFPVEETKDDYYLFVGRLTWRKGYTIAADVCKHLGARLIVAGVGSPPEYGEYVGTIDETRRGELMSRAKAVFVPTIYNEPFGGVAIEAMMCGTPVITTDWGAMTETVIHGVTGYRCRTMGEFIWAANNVGALDPYEIRRYALMNYSVDRVAQQYQAYFNQLETLWGDGWHDMTPSMPDRTRKYL